MVDRSGQRLGHYLLIRLIGRGGYGDVYLAQNLNLGSLCAIKLLRTSLLRKELRLFVREARLTAKLDNKYIIRVLDASSHKGIPYIVMDYAPHGSLSARHPHGKPAPFDVILRYLEQISEALDYLSTRNLIHMDIKPENFLVGHNYEVLLGDFGISTSIYKASGSTRGTLYYMSPEHISGHPGPYSDQYALAVCAYKWLTGYLPFYGTPAEIKQQHLYERPGSLRALAPDIPRALEKVVLRALSKDPQRRYPSAGAFVAAFKAAMPPVLPPAETLSIRDYLLKIETWEEISRFFASKIFVSTVVGVLTYLVGKNINFALIAFGASLPLMPLPGVLRKSNQLAQAISITVFLISLVIGVGLHNLLAFAISQVFLLAFGRWVAILRKWLLAHQ